MIAIDKPLVFRIKTDSLQNRPRPFHRAALLQIIANLNYALLALPAQPLHAHQTTASKYPPSPDAQY
jgi:hypothetical protein